MSYLNDIKSMWESVKESLGDSLAQSVIDLWFGELKIVSFENNCLSFSTDSEFKHKIISEKYLDMLKERFKDFLGFDININIVFSKSDIVILAFSFCSFTVSSSFTILFLLASIS